MNEAPLYAGTFVGGALLGGWLALSAARGLDTRRRRKRAARATRGERRAQRASVRAGYAVRGTQIRGGYTMWVDGEPWPVGLRPDLQLAKRGRRVVAEVKTGRPADPAHDGTRRQLLEYAHAFGLERILLVEGDSGRIREVRFALNKPRRVWTLLLLSVGLACGWASADRVRPRLEAWLKALPCAELRTLLQTPP